MPTIELFDGPHLHGQTVSPNHPERVVPYLSAYLILPETPLRLTSHGIGRGTRNHVQIVGDLEVHRRAEAYIRHSGRAGDGWWLVAAINGRVAYAQPGSQVYTDLTEADGGVRLIDRMTFEVHNHRFIYLSRTIAVPDNIARRVIARDVETWENNPDQDSIQTKDPQH